ncbi:heterokaryon incompatibility protein-domain-containing protein [Cladorrhinum sp. PSN332]|nr:heterokaryon incompatibility protein-domain-containing protein [Cladorrhinum sp. PSN332]
MYTSSSQRILSPCWGKRATITTTRSSYVEYRRGIRLDLLPKTLRDAVFVCRGLKIHYLWIDALCIVQDDPDDWRRESAQMHSIYGNSYITFAAHEAESCTDGFLGQQAFGQPTWQRPFYVPLGSVKMHLRTGSTNWRWGTNSNSPLMRRGWTLQEALLPRRPITRAKVATVTKKHHIYSALYNGGKMGNVIVARLHNGANREIQFDKGRPLEHANAPEGQEGSWRRVGLGYYWATTSPNSNEKDPYPDPFDGAEIKKIQII